MAYIANPVHADGTNDYLSLTAALTGSADSKLWTGSLWFRRVGNTGVQQYIVTGFASTAYRWLVFFSSANRIIMAGRSGTTEVLNLQGPVITDTNWHHLMWSVDLTDTAKRHLYIDGSDAFSSAPTYSDVAITFTGNRNGVFGSPTGASKWYGDTAEVQIWFGVYLDLSIQANRELFYRGGGPVDPATASATLGTPIILLSGATDTWHTNDGSGGGYTENGALTDGGTALPVDSTPTGYDPLVADVAHFTMTGYPAALRVSRLLSAQAGSFDMTGYPAGLYRGFTLAADPGSFEMTGYAAGLQAHRMLQVAAGSFVMTGYPTGIRVGRKLSADVGHFALTGYPVALVYHPLAQAYTLVAEVGHFVMTGYDASLRAGRRLVAATGSFEMTGYPAGLFRGYRLVAAPGSFDMTGYPVAFSRGYRLVAAPGSFAMTGYDAGLDYTRRLLAKTGHFLMTGYSAGLLYTGGSQPLNRFTDVIPSEYTPLPAVPNDPVILAEEFRNLQIVLQYYSIITPQVSDREPQIKLRSMMRCAISPWDPLNTAGAWPYWVWWDGATWQPL